MDPAHVIHMQNHCLQRQTTNMTVKYVVYVTVLMGNAFDVLRNMMPVDIEPTAGYPDMSGFPDLWEMN